MKIKPENINVLIACEESQAECLAFRQLGFNAYSCDIQLCKFRGKIQYHIPADVTPLLEGKTTFMTQDGVNHRLKEWHLIIAHPPCTYLCKVGSVHMRINTQFRSVAQSCPTLCDPMKRSTPGLPVHHQLPEFTQTHVHRVSDAIKPSHPLLSPSPPAFSLSQHQGLFQ